MTSDTTFNFISDYIKSQPDCSNRWWSVERFPKKRCVILPSDPKLVKGIQLKPINDGGDMIKFRMQLSNAALYYLSDLITVPEVLLTENGDIDLDKWHRFEFNEYFEVVGKNQVRFKTS